MIISFAYVWPSVVAREKTVTRRDWTNDHAYKFVAGFEFDAYDAAPFRHGRKIARCRMLETAYPEQLWKMPDSDYAAEGFQYFNRNPQALPVAARGNRWAADDCSFEAFKAWRTAKASTLWVVRFEILRVEPAAVGRLQTILESDGTRKA